MEFIQNAYQRKVPFLFFAVSAVALCLTSCQNPSDSGSQGPLHPPRWIQGNWEGGSPIKVHLQFTSNNCYDNNNKEQFPGYTEGTISDSKYVLVKDNWTSIFQPVSSRTMDWYVNNGKLDNITRMTKK